MLTEFLTTKQGICDICGKLVSGLSQDYYSVCNRCGDVVEMMCPQCRAAKRCECGGKYENQFEKFGGGVMH